MDSTLGLVDDLAVDAVVLFVIVCGFYWIFRSVFNRF